MRLFTLLFLTSVSTILFSQDLNDLYDELDGIYQEVILDGQVDYEAATRYRSDLQRIAGVMGQGSVRTLQGEQEQMLLINAYNLHTILQVLTYQPMTTVKRFKDFFSNKHTVLGQQLSLNEIEQLLLKSGDARIHMVLVCGAKSCPPLLGRTYKSESDVQGATAYALSQPQVLDLDDTDKTARISNIFRWYKKDFGDPMAWIGDQLGRDLSDYKVSYLDYDWSLNDIRKDNTTATSPAPSVSSGLGNTNRYFASRLYDRGQYEVNVFNNYYSQVDGRDRYSFFTSTVTYLMGINTRLNVGIDARIRGVSRGIDDPRFAALNFANDGFTGDNDYTRSGLSAIGPRVKYQPWADLGNITFQHILFFPTTRDGGGNSETGFIDWGSPVLWNDIFYDQELTDKTSFFVQAGLYFENVNRATFRAGEGYWQLSTPVNLIFNYFHDDKSTFYALMGTSPRWGYNVSNGGDDIQVIPDDFSQFGAGYKYFITDAIQAEVLYTRFYSVVPGRSANTYNIGVRYYHW